MAGGEAAAVGIDLGMTYSCLGAWKNGRVEIIVNEQGNRTTPSCVAFNDHERLIGEGALNQIARNPTNTIFDAKRLIGRSFSEENVQGDMKLWPFKVVSGEKDTPSIVVRYMGEQKSFAAEEISAMVLSKMKKMASEYLGCEVKKAVVTVPAYFNNSQRQATKDAGTIAGLDVMQVLNEPTAAALAYGVDNKDSCRGGKKLVLIFDLGGGTFDVSLLELDGHGVIEVKATNGDTHLGGQDFDNRMVHHLLDVIRKRYKQDLRENNKAVRKLKTACEKAKRILSTSPLTQIDIDALLNGDDFSMSFSRATFEEINKDLFEKCMGPVEHCLKDANVEKHFVDEIVLVGGSTRIPKVREMLEKYFDGKQLCSSINADEAVACGASIQAAILNGDKNETNAPEIALLDVTPISLGLKDYVGVMSIVIPKNTRIPCKKDKRFCTAEDNVTSTPFIVYEGERSMATDNHFLGQFEIHGIRPAPRGEIKFKAIFDMDVNGILSVSARNLDNDDRGGITISRDMLTLDKDKIDRMIREAKTYEMQDLERKKAAIAKDKLERYASMIEGLIVESRVRSKLTKNSWLNLESVLNNVRDWVEFNADAPDYEFEMKNIELKRVWEPVKRELMVAGFSNLNIES